MYDQSNNKTVRVYTFYIYFFEFHFSNSAFLFYLQMYWFIMD